MTGERAGPAWLWSDEPIPDPLGRADKAVRFLKKLRLHEGRFAGQKFPLQDWQERLIRKIYGPVELALDVRGLDDLDVTPTGPVDDFSLDAG